MGESYIFEIFEAFYLVNHSTGFYLLLIFFNTGSLNMNETKLALESYDHLLFINIAQLQILESI
jgi:hypothetical protein